MTHIDILGTAIERNSKIHNYCSLCFYKFLPNTNGGFYLGSTKFIWIGTVIRLAIGLVRSCARSASLSVCATRCVFIPRPMVINMVFNFCTPFIKTLLPLKLAYVLTPRHENINEHYLHNP